MSIWGNPVMLGGSGGGGEGIPSGPIQPTGGSDGDLYVQTFPVAIGVNYVEYLESSGTQYINTGIIGNQDTGYLYDQETTIAAWGFGARQSAQTRAVVITSDGTSATANTFDLGSERKTISNIPARRKMVLKNKVLSINGAVKAGYGMPSAFTTPNPLLLFGVYNGGSVAISGGFKVYRAAIYDGYMPVADYIPCLDGNGVACMWDNVAGQYVYNTGTGTFAYGSSVNPDPLEPILWQKQSGAWVVIGG